MRILSPESVYARTAPALLLCGFHQRQRSCQLAPWFRLREFEKLVRVGVVCAGSGLGLPSSGLAHSAPAQRALRLLNAGLEPGEMISEASRKAGSALTAPWIWLYGGVSLF